MRDMEKAGKQLLSDEELNFINGGERCGWVWGTRTATAARLMKTGVL